MKKSRTISLYGIFNAKKRAGKGGCPVFPALTFVTRPFLASD